MRAVMLRHRHRLLVVLSVIALIGQLLLPAVHAQSRVRNGADPLLYAYCGEVSSQVAAALRQQLAQSAAAADFAGPQEARDPRASGLSCDACASVHAAQLGTAGPTGIGLPSPTVERPLALASLSHAAPRQLRLPPAQAPPRFT